MSLFEISAEVRIIIRWILIGIGVLFVAWLLYISTLALISALTPKKPTLPTVAFGKLPAPIVSNGAISPASIDLETADGALPSFTGILEVYPIPEPGGKINSLDLATKKSQQYGVGGTPKALSPTLYQWQNSRLPALSITIDIVTGSFTYNYDWIADPTVLPISFDRDELAAAGPLAQGFLSQGFSGVNDFKDGEAKANYVHIAGSERTKVSSPSQANAVEVDVFRKKLNSKYSVVSLNPTQSLMRVLVVPDKPNNSSVNVLQANFTHWQVDFANSSTYPLRTANQAFDDLKADKAYVVAGRIDGLSRIKISSVELSYLETEKYSAYLQPIYVFKGQSQSGRTKADFMAYVPAVRSDWIRTIQ